MASEWKATTLEEPLDFSNGRSSPARDESGVFNVFGSNGIIGRASVSNSPPGTIIIGRVGSYCGSLHYSAEPCWVTDNAIKAVARDGHSPVFLRYLLQTLGLNHWRGGSGQPLLNQSTLNSIPVRLPPKNMQDKIATLLGTLDKRIDLAADANSSLEMIAGAIFKSWFVDFDPVRAKAQGHEPEGMDAATAALFPDELIESGKGELPRGWSIQQLSDFVAVNPLRSLSKAVPAPYLEMANAPTSGPRPAGWVNRVPISGCRFRNGDTLLAKITPCLENGKTAFVDFLDEGQTGWGSTEFVVLTPKPPIPPVFGYLLARDEAFRAHAIQSMSGTSGRQRIQVDQLAKFEFAVADADVYGAFGAIVQPMFESIKHNDEMAKTLADLRDTLLPRLISGKLRVPEAEKLVEAVL